ncbi:AAA family ATPase [Arthrobacter agilis]|uniref:AAA family ATPase n=1 Tax=Arthrobacter agilis TaxID=37921 RepID=UPI0036194E6F
MSGHVASFGSSPPRLLHSPRRGLQAATNLILDEPGLNLHATAQADLLRFIDERLAPSHQVLFSTHSPFMINAHKFGRVRTVVDDEQKGTKCVC